ncbi:hypothetical protein OQI_28550, partial [Streptomyces pharetrae CZA14]
RTGKPAGGDIREGKATYVTALARARAEATADHRALAVLDRASGGAELTPDGLDEVREVLVVTGARAAVEARIARLVTQGLRHVDRACLEPESGLRLRSLLRSVAGEPPHATAPPLRPAPGPAGTGPLITSGADVKRSRAMSGADVPEARAITGADVPEALAMSGVDVPEAPTIHGVDVPEAPTITGVDGPEAPTITGVDVPEALAMSGPDGLEAPTFTGVHVPEALAMSGVDVPEAPTITGVDVPEAPTIHGVDVPEALAMPGAGLPGAPALSAPALPQTPDTGPEETAR